MGFNNYNQNNQVQQPIRVKVPRGREVLGVVEQRVGGKRMLVRCMDGKTRNCRVPGRVKIKMWIKEGDVVLVEPWELGGDEKGEVLFKYSPTEIQWLKRKGIFKEVEGEF
ncbi:translation initiation factor IF-1A [Candidatus Woesearchaeota archaeon CG10_big_fil_rev_8_21_14_0_10_34_12]|nr:MAG: translation initiation factor IF-1A [Candidatus Woesearchaeota archaeon CG10_big_fil_rev_8_21_14_0_10_34_12]